MLTNIHSSLTWAEYFDCEECPSHQKKKKKVQGVPQAQAVAYPRHKKKEETDKIKQAQIEQRYEKH